MWSQAQIDQQTKVLRAEQYQLSILPKTRAKSTLVEKAKQASLLVWLCQW